MKLKDIYKLQPMSVSHDFNLAFQAIQDLARSNSGDICYKLDQFCHSVEDFIYQLNIDTCRFQINMYMDEGDDKYGARLYTVVFDGVPIMMVKNNGRYYDTFNAYLSNQQQLYIFLDYIYSLIDADENLGKPEVVSEDEDIAELTKIGDYELFNYYDQNNNPQYKKNDLVWAWADAVN